MRWRVLAAAVVIGAVVLPLAAGAQPPDGTSRGGPPPDQAPGSSVPATSGAAVADSAGVVAAADDAALIVAETAGLLDLLGAFAPSPEIVGRELEPVYDEVGWEDDDRADLVDELTRLELDAEDVLLVLLDEDVPLSREVQEALGGPSDDAWAAIEAGDVTDLDAGLYLAALDDLVQRNGRGPDAGTIRPVDGEVLALAIAAEYADVDESDGAGGGEGSGTATDAASTDAGSDLVLVLVVVVALAVGVGVVIGLRRRRPGGGDQFDELLEVSRAMSSARTTEEVERGAAEQIARLLGGAGSTTGALVRRSTAGLTLGHQTRDGVLDGALLGDGVLGRVLASGQPFSGVVDQEPAIRSLPAAVLAVPVIGDGVVVGIVVAIRRPERPFGEDDLGLVTRFGPIVATALESARRSQESDAASLTDPLTSVGNRRKLERDLPAVLATAEGATGLVMVDLDHFKAVNDGHGHPAGDAILREVAAVLSSLLRPGDGLYRYGGEEFTIILPGADEAAAVTTAERARAALRVRDLDLGNGSHHRLTASLGVAAAVAGDVDGLGLVARADRALYEAKATGRDRVVASGAHAD